MPIDNHCTMIYNNIVEREKVKVVVKRKPTSVSTSANPHTTKAALSGYTGICEGYTMDRDTLLETTNTVKAGDRAENAYWLAAAANALAHELIYANKGQIGRYDAWEVAAMIEAATDAAMTETAILSESLCDEAREKAEKANQQRDGYAPKN